MSCLIFSNKLSTTKLEAEEGSETEPSSEEEEEVELPSVPRGDVPGDDDDDFFSFERRSKF